MIWWVSGLSQEWVCSQPHPARLPSHGLHSLPWGSRSHLGPCSARRMSPDMASWPYTWAQRRLVFITYSICISVLLRIDSDIRLPQDLTGLETPWLRGTELIELRDFHFVAVSSKLKHPSWKVHGGLWDPGSKLTSQTQESRHHKSLYALLVL